MTIKIMTNEKKIEENNKKRYRLYVENLYKRLNSKMDEFFTVEDACVILDKSQSTISHYINRGKMIDKKLIKLVAFKNSKGQYRIRKKNLLQFIKKTRTVIKEEK